MTKSDLLKMLSAAEEMTHAAQRHENALRSAVRDWDNLPDHSDYAVVGESSPISQALTHWRGLMAVMFPLQEENPAEMAALAETLKSWGRE